MRPEKLFRKSTKRIVACVIVVAAMVMTIRISWAIQTIQKIERCLIRPDEIGFAPSILSPEQLAQVPSKRFAAPIARAIPRKVRWSRDVATVAFLPVTHFEAFYFVNLQGDLGAELLRFTSLREVAIEDTMAPGPGADQWRQLCTRLRMLPKLRELEIGGDQLNDDSLAPLAGHPALRSIEITRGRVTMNSLQTWAALPNLKKLSFGEMTYSGDAWLTPEERTMLRTRLPATEINFPP